MILKGPEHYYVSKNLVIEENLPIETKVSFNILKTKYGYTGRMTSFIRFLEDVFGIKEFEFFDTYTWNKEEFLSYLLDKQINYQKGETLDMAQLHKDILTAYEFTRKEKRMFIEENIEKRLWGIFIYLDNPGRENFKFNYIKNND